MATPTTLEHHAVLPGTLQLLEDSSAEQRSGWRARQELSKVLGLFKKGVALLDEVDLILHPLKSELNFPIGDKFDLDGSDDGQRWNCLFIMDAIFFAQTTTRPARTLSLSAFSSGSPPIKIIEEVHAAPAPPTSCSASSTVVRRSFGGGWCYLWLQKQHLHGSPGKPFDS